MIIIVFRFEGKTVFLIETSTIWFSVRTTNVSYQGNLMTNVDNKKT